jgi:rfaE bifunctional protein nucleotidyltransferase chain/domain
MQAQTQTPPTLDRIRSKIFDLAQIKHRVAMWKLLSKKIVFTNGCFDLIHLGHIDYLAKAADEGDELIIGLNTDASTNRLKGQHRPINNQEQRAMILAAFGFVSAVVCFDEPTPYELIKAIEPHVLVKGGDYKVEEIVGQDIVLAKNGVVKTIDFLPGYSTTLIEEKIRKSAIK